MIIRLINTENPIDVAKFIDFPFRLYKGNPYWTPPLISDIKFQMNKQKHPFYLHSKADFMIVESEGEVLGRVAVIYNRNYSAHFKRQIASFYYFESTNNPEVGSLLVNGIINWAKEQKCDLILGPKGMVRSAGMGMLIEGFEYLPGMGIPYNPPYYAKYFEDAGFIIETDHISGYLNRSSQFPQRLQEAAEKIRNRGSFWVKTFRNKAEMRKWIPKVDEVHRKAFQDLPWFYPATRDEFQLIAKTMIQIADPRFVKLIMKDDQVVGFILTYVNFNKGLQKAKGRLWPLGWIYILKDKWSSPIADANGIGLLPEYQGMGANILLYAEMEKTLRSARQLQMIELIQVDIRNFRSKSDMQNMGVNWCKRHRTFRLELT